MLLVCPHCFSTNRIPEDRSHVSGQCGKCKESLKSSAPPQLNDTTFHPYVEKNDLPIVVDFWASWCGPCKAMAPTFAKVAEQSESILFAKVNTEKAQQVSSEATIRSIPTLILFYGGKEITRVSGAMSEPQLKQWIAQSVQSISS